MKPWEKYGAQTGSQMQGAKPWEKYGAQPGVVIAEEVVANEKPSLSRTILEQGLQGGTFGFADELTDALAAGAVAPFVDESFGELYNQARNSSSAMLKDQMEKYPVTSILSNIAGGAITSGAGATTKAGQALWRNVSNSGLAGKIAKSAGLGAASSGLYSIGAGEDGQRTDNLARDAVLGGVIGGAIPVAGHAFNKLNTKTIVPNADEIRAIAGDLYNQASQSGAVFKPEFTNKFIDSVEKMTHQTEAGKILGGNSAFTDVVERIKGLRDRPINMLELQEIDEILGDLVDDFVDAGRVTKQGKKILDIQSTLREMAENAPDDMVSGGAGGSKLLKDARQMWGISKRMDDIEKIIMRADMYEQPATAIKNGFRTLYNNPSRMRGYSAEEKEMIKKAAEFGVVADGLRLAGSRLIPLLAGSSGGFGAAALAHAGSAAARSGAARVQAGKAANVAKKVADRAGLTRTEKRIVAPAFMERLTNDFNKLKAK